MEQINEGLYNYLIADGATNDEDESMILPEDIPGEEPPASADWMGIWDENKEELPFPPDLLEEILTSPEDEDE